MAADTTSQDPSRRDSVRSLPPTRPGFVTRWVVALRPASFTASLIPLVLGTALAPAVTSWGRFVLALWGTLGLHAGTNLINDYEDHVRGTDTPDALGPSLVIQRGMIAAEAVWRGGVLAFAFGAAAGLALAALAGWPILLLGVAGVVAGHQYTGGPLALAYRGLGEATVFVFMGPVIVLGAFYLQTESITATPLLASLPIGFLVTAILHANNLRDIENDRRSGKRTLAVRFGRTAAVWELGALYVAAFASLVVLVVAGVVPGPSLAALLTIPRAWSALQRARIATSARGLNAVLIRSVEIHLAFGVLYVTAVVLG